MDDILALTRKMHLDFRDGRDVGPTRAVLVAGRAAQEIERLRDLLATIAYCDEPKHEKFEPHPLYRSHMITIAKRGLKGIDPYTALEQ